MMQQQQRDPMTDVLTAIPFYNLPKKQLGYFQAPMQTAAAAADPTSKQFQNIYGRSKAFRTQSLANTIAELQRQNRKAATMGRTPLLNTERGGEQLFRSAAQEQMNVDELAAEDATNMLNNLAQAQSGFAKQQALLAQNKAGIKGNLMGALGNLFRLEK